MLHSAIVLLLIIEEQIVMSACLAKHTDLIFLFVTRSEIQVSDGH